jgi:hypothetical protein
MKTRKRRRFGKSRLRADARRSSSRPSFHAKLRSNHRDAPKNDRKLDTSDLRIDDLSSATSGQSHLAILDESKQGSAIVRVTFSGFSPGTKAAFGISLVPAQQRQRERLNAPWHRTPVQAIEEWMLKKNVLSSATWYQ